MRQLFFVMTAMLVPAGTADSRGEQPAVQSKEVRQLYTEQDLAKLKFLEGRWVGKAPNGKEFFEQYDFPSPIAFRSQRYEGSDFAKSTDSSIVELKDGKLISTWGQFTWEATRVENGLVEFSPLAAPSSFSWKRLSSDAVEVSQNWTDADGKAQSYSLILERLR